MPVAGVWLRSSGRASRWRSRHGGHGSFFRSSRQRKVTLDSHVLRWHQWHGAPLDCCRGRRGQNARFSLSDDHRGRLTAHYPSQDSSGQVLVVCDGRVIEPLELVISYSANDVRCKTKRQQEDARFLSPVLHRRSSSGPSKAAFPVSSPSPSRLARNTGPPSDLRSTLGGGIFAHYGHNFLLKTVPYLPPTHSFFQYSFLAYFPGLGVALSGAVFPAVAPSLSPVTWHAQHELQNGPRSRTIESRPLRVSPNCRNRAQKRE